MLVFALILPLAILVPAHEALGQRGGGGSRGGFGSSSGGLGWGSGPASDSGGRSGLRDSGDPVGPSGSTILPGPVTDPSVLPQPPGPGGGPSRTRPQPRVADPLPYRPHPPIPAPGNGEAPRRRPNDPMDPNKMPAPPGAGSEGVAGVPPATSGGGSSAPSAPVGSGAPVRLDHGTAPPEVIAALKSDAHQEFIRRCDPWAKKMLSWRQEWDKTPPLTLPEPKLRSALGVLEKYDQECLRPPAALSEVLQTPGALEYVKARVGVVFFDGVPVCTGAWVAPSWVLTARHCVFTDEYDANLKIHRFFPRDPTDFAFALDVPTATTVGVRAMIDSGAYAQRSELFDDLQDADDQVLLELAAPPVAGTFPGIALAEPGDHDRLLVYAFHFNANLIEAFRRKLDGRPETELDLARRRWKEVMRFDAAQTCRIARIEKGACLIHACQSEFQTSGAPMLRIGPDGHLELVGIHIRSLATNDGGACAHSDERVPNIGVSLESSIRSKLSGIPENGRHRGLTIGGNPQ